MRRDYYLRQLSIVKHVKRDDDVQNRHSLDPLWLSYPEDAGADWASSMARCAALSLVFTKEADEHQNLFKNMYCVQLFWRSRCVKKRITCTAYIESKPIVHKDPV